MPKPTDAWFGWFIRRLKSQLRGIRIFLTEAKSLSPMPVDLWNIVVDYVCEDPVVVDIIIGITDPWIIDFGPDSCISLSWGYTNGRENSDLELTYTYQMDNKDYILCIPGGDVLQTLLMLPLVNNSGISSVAMIHPNINNGIVAMRRALYERLRGPEGAKKCGMK